MAYLSLQNITKSFYGVEVLSGVSLDVERGEVLGLVGENGAGKSTLMNITSGLLERDGGNVLVDGCLSHFNHPVEAAKKGIVHIHQELNILPELTIIENLFLGKEIKKFGILQKEAMRIKAQEIFKELDQKLDLFLPAGNLSIGHQQMIEIAKSLLHNDVRLIILDEPSASLADHEIKTLFKIIKHLKETKQVSFIYVSHRMQELFRICDRLTVLRDGSFIGTKKIKETNLDEIVSMMIGRSLEHQYLHRKNKKCNDEADALLKVNSLSKSKRFNNISFSLKKGEILGFYGLVGAGRTDVVQAIFGVNNAELGDIYFEGKKYQRPRPSQSIKLGIGFVSENRKFDGILDNFSVKYNITISNFIEMTRLKFINNTNENKIVDKLIAKLAVKVANINNSILTLSGGNQQKTLLARCFNYPLKVLILDEPTRGIDIGSKHDIYEIIQELSEEGIGVIFVSSDLPEVLGVSDRIAVMHEGSLVDIVDAQHTSQDDIMHLSANTKAIKEHII